MGMAAEWTHTQQQAQTLSRISPGQQLQSWQPRNVNPEIPWTGSSGLHSQQDTARAMGNLLSTVGPSC